MKHVQVLLTLSPATRDALDEQANAIDDTRSGYVSRLVRLNAPVRQRGKLEQAQRTPGRPKTEGGE